VSVTTCHLTAYLNDPPQRPEATGSTVTLSRRRRTCSGPTMTGAGASTGARWPSVPE